LEAVMAQRLVRRLCTECKQPYRSLKAEARLLNVSLDTELFRAKGCEHCKQSGYRGRIGLYELIKVNDQLRQLIHEGAAESALLAQARLDSVGIDDAARQRILAGDTSTEEVLRVTALG